MLVFQMGLGGRFVVHQNLWLSFSRAAFKDLILVFQKPVSKMTPITMNWVFCWVPKSFDLQRIQTFSYKTQKDEALLQNKIKETGLPFYQSRFAKLQLAVLMSTVCSLRDNIILQSHLGICFLRGFPWCFNQSEVFIHKPVPHLFFCFIFPAFVLEVEMLFAHVK